MDRSRCALLGIVIACSVKQKIKEKRRKEWMKPYLSRRSELGSYRQIFHELCCDNKKDLEHYIRIPFAAFQWLLNKIDPVIRRQDTHLRPSISPGARLEATLLFLSCGLPYAKLTYFSRISVASLSFIIPETCEAIFNVLRK